MSAVIAVLALSALIGFALGGLLSWPAIAVASIGFAVLSAAALQIKGFGASPGIVIVVACLTATEVAYLASACLVHHRRNIADRPRQKARYPFV